MNMCPSNKCKTSPELCLKGQVFFIWTNYPSLDTVKDKISLLGGKVEQFLSRDVTTILVEDNQLVGSELLSPDLSVKSSYAANGAIVTSFPHPSNLSSLPSTSRGYFLASSTSSKSSVYPPYRIICYARQWGIQVLGIYQFLTWIEPHCKIVSRQKQRKTIEHIFNLSGCFIKFESLQKNYRPCYRMFNNDPDRLLPLKNASILVKPEAYNVILDKPIGSRQQVHFNLMDTAVKTTHQGKGANLSVKANEKKPQNKLRPKEESNYCECCRTHFADLKQHIKSTKHQNFVSNEKNYEGVHNILKMLPTPQEFIEKLQNPSPNADSVLTNGDASHCTSVANVPETDYSLPLNLQIRKENIAGAVVPADMHIEKNEILSHNLHVVKDENMPLPLDLHIKKDNMKSEAKEIKQEANLFVNFEEAESHKKENPAVVQPKLEIEEDSVVENAKINEKHPAEIPAEDHCDEVNGDPLFDKTNTTALAQLCLKNFDSYWLDSLPCEMDDIIFDDIFDFDDGKTKVDNECIETFAESFINSDVAQTPGLVSGISTPNLRTQTAENTSILMSNAVDVKDCITTEPPNLQSFSPACKLEKEFETLSPQNVAASLNETPLEEKKQIFSIAAFCSDKIGMEAAPSCSNTLVSKDPEPLFSSESSDDENGHVLISNALNMITNSDSDMKADRESSEENSIQEPCEAKAPRARSSIVVQNDKKCDQSILIKKDQRSKEIAIKADRKERSLMIHNSPVRKNEINIDSPAENNSAKPFTAGEMKIESQSRVGISKPNKIASSHPKVPDTNYKENFILENNMCNSGDSRANFEILEEASVKKKCSDVITDKDCVINFSADNERVLHKMKTDQESRKENASSETKQDWNLPYNKINQKYPVSLNRAAEDTKVLKERLYHKEDLEETPVTGQNKLPVEMKVCKENTSTDNRESWDPKNKINQHCPVSASRTVENVNVRVAKEKLSHKESSGEISALAESKLPVEIKVCNENASFDQKERDLSYNKINQNCPISVNRTIESAKMLKERISHKESLGEIPASVENKLPVEMKVCEDNAPCDRKEEWNLPYNKIKQKYRVPENRAVDDGKKLKERLSYKESSGETSSVQSKLPVEMKVCKDNTSFDRKEERSLPYNKINQKYPVSVNRAVADMKTLPERLSYKESSGEISASGQSRLADAMKVCENNASFDRKEEWNLSCNKVNPKHSVPVNRTVEDAMLHERLNYKERLAEIPSSQQSKSTNETKIYTNSPSSDIKKKWNFSCNKIDNKYPAQMNNAVEDSKVVKERVNCKKGLGECPVSVQSKVPEEGLKISKDASEKYVIPKKNVSLREMKVNPNTSVQSCISAPSIPCEQKTDQTSYGTVLPVKKVHSKELKMYKKEKGPEMKINQVNSDSRFISAKAVPPEKKVDHVRGQTVTYGKRPYSKEKKSSHKRIKEDSSLYKQYIFSETDAKNDIKEQSPTDSVNPCQYSYRNKICEVDTSKLPVESSVTKQTKKIPHKRKCSKLRKLPPLWSVSIVPGSGVKLKFTCIHSKNVDAHQFETDDYSD